MTLLGMCVCVFNNLLRHVSILYARVEQLEVAGEQVPPRQVVCTATSLRKVSDARGLATLGKRVGGNGHPRG